MRERLAADLARALKARDAREVAALRSAIAALDNAGAVPTSEQPAVASADSTHVAGTVSGLGAAEVPRRPLAPPDLRRVLELEVAERLTAARQLAALGKQDQADRLVAEAEVVQRYLR